MKKNMECPECDSKVFPLPHFICPKCDQEFVSNASLKSEKISLRLEKIPRTKKGTQIIQAKNRLLKSISQYQRMNLANH